MIWNIINVYQKTPHLQELNIVVRDLLSVGLHLFHNALFTINISRTDWIWALVHITGLSKSSVRSRSPRWKGPCERKERESDPEKSKVWGGWRWSWSLFFCAPALDHLHQVDIRRVYSGVCNCILSLVLHCQPWKWNLINPDQFLMYKMNWQRFKKRELQFKSGEWYMYFSSLKTSSSTPPSPNQPRSPLSYYNGFIFLSEEGQEPGGLKEGNRRCCNRKKWLNCSDLL